MRRSYVAVGLVILIFCAITAFLGFGQIEEFSYSIGNYYPPSVAWVVFVAFLGGVVGGLITGYGCALPPSEKKGV